MFGTMYALRSGRKINPTNPEDSDVWSNDLTLHVVEKDGKLRAFTTFGSLMEVGRGADFQDDQSGRDLSNWLCVSTRHPDGTVTGAPLPDRALPHWVAK